MQLQVHDDYRSELCSRVFPARLSIDGIASAALQKMLGGHSVAELWADSVRGTARVGLADESARPGQAADSQTIELVDGRVRLRSGGAAELIVGPQHRVDATLWPMSLHLIACQQWARCGLMPVHAAALQIRGRGVLALGRRGCGKSILSLAALRAGHGLVSDDWVLLGEHGGRVLAERLRSFLMLRAGWASSALTADWTGADGLSAASVPNKRVLTLPVDVPHSPDGMCIDEIWLLERPDGARPLRSQAMEVDQARVLARLVESAMPLLLSAAFPLERQRLLALCLRLIAGSRLRSVVTGTELVAAPDRELDRLCAWV